MTSTKMSGTLNMRLSPTMSRKFSAKLLGGVALGALMMAATVLPLTPDTVAADEHIAPVVETTRAERSLELVIDETVLDLSPGGDDEEFFVEAQPPIVQPQPAPAPVVQENGGSGDLGVTAPEFVVDADQEIG